MSLNKGFRQGNLVADPEIKMTNANVPVCRFRIAVNRRHKSANGYVNKAAFLQCEAWAKGAEAIHKHFKKGSPIIIEESIIQDDYKDKDGKERSVLVFRVEQFHFVPGYDYENHCWAAGNSRKAAQADEQAGNDGGGDDGPPPGGTEDIPF